MRSIECWKALALVFLTGAVAFRITEYPRTHQEITQTPRTHQEITQTAVLDAVVRTCRSLAEVEGRAFSLPVRNHLSNAQHLLPSSQTIYTVCACV